MFTTLFVPSISTLEISNVMSTPQTFTSKVCCKLCPRTVADTVKDVVPYSLPVTVAVAPTLLISAISLCPASSQVYAISSFVIGSPFHKTETSTW